MIIRSMERVVERGLLRLGDEAVGEAQHVKSLVARAGAHSNVVTRAAESNGMPAGLGHVVARVTVSGHDSGVRSALDALAAIGYRAAAR